MKKLCECGCGKETLMITHTNNKRNRFFGEYNRFIIGHWKSNLGRKYSYKKRRPLSKETKEKIKNRNIGKKYPKELYPNSGMRNKHHTEESRNKISEHWNYEKNITKERNKRISESLMGNILPEEVRIKISNSLKGREPGNKGKKFPKEQYPNYGWRTSRKNQILPFNDTSIEKIIQNFLTLLHKEYVTHKYMNIEHHYRCDIFIPKQEGIEQDTIIECDGDFFHCNPAKYNKDFRPTKNSLIAEEKWKLDAIRTKELQEKGYKVIRLWEHKIRTLSLNKFKEML